MSTVEHDTPTDAPTDTTADADAGDVDQPPVGDDHRDEDAYDQAHPRDYERFIPQTDEGGQQMRPRSELTAAEVMREVGAVLRMAEAEAATLGDLPEDPEEDQTMIINMGPQHPSTHGVLRLMLELQGETGAALQADHRLPAHRDGEDRRVNSRSSRAAPT